MLLKLLRKKLRVRLLFAAGLCLSCGPAAAQHWFLIDKFDAAESIGWTLDCDYEKCGLRVLEDPISEGNFGLHLAPSPEETGEISISRPLPFRVKQGEVVTFYWRAWMSGPDANWRISFSSDSGNSEAFSVAADQTMIGDRVYPLNIPLDTGSWYEYSLSFHPDQDELKLFINPDPYTGEIPITLVKTRGNVDKLSFDTITITAEAGADEWLVDDIYAAPVEDNPIPGYGIWPWCEGWALDYWGNVNTAGWLGHTNATHDPWIWIWSINSWIYAPPSMITTDGAWVFSPRY